MNYFHLELEVGKIAFVWNESGLLSQVRILDCGSDEKPKRPLYFRARNVPTNSLSLIEKICLYFEGGQPLGEPDWDKLEMSHWTDFQKQVYQAAAQIPHGESRPYAWIGEKIGRPLASRAVGQALRRNPIPILIPCHRVVAANGGLGGFMGKSDPNNPELKLKKHLLDIEHRYRNPFLPFMNVSMEGKIFSSPRSLTQAKSSNDSIRLSQNQDLFSLA